MAFRQPIICVLLLLVLCHLASAAKYFLPLIKDDSKTQFYTTFVVGTPPVRVNAAVDLGNKYNWLACSLIGYNKSSTYAVIPCDGNDCDGCISCGGPVATPACNNNSCGAVAYTPWSDGLYSSGLISDTISLYSTSAHKSASLPKFQFACADGTGPLKGLSGHTKGVVTLARTATALHAQVSSALMTPRKFALCAPSGLYGTLYFGGGPYFLRPSTADLSKSLVTTALIINPSSTAPIYSEGEASVEYFINVRSIKIDAAPVKFNSSLLSFDKDGSGGTKISTIDPYTTLHSQIYKPFLDLFMAKAAALKLVKVAPVAPFGACFSSKSIRYNAKTGKGIPIIDLVFNEKSAVLHGKNARWRIYGSNSMVKVSSDVQCLGIVDAGKYGSVTSVVIGAKQLEDNLVEFDLQNGKLGFTSSLLHLGTSCSNCIILLLLVCHLASAAQYYLPLVKDDNKTQIYTTFVVGTPPVRVNVAVDLGNKYSWFTCDLIGYNKSSTYAVVPCDGNDCDGCISCGGSVATPTCNNNSCGAVAYSPWSDALYSSGLITDTISLYSSAPPKSASLPKFRFACADGAGPLKGLSGHTKGVVTLARTATALQAQVSSTLKTPQKFALCSPSGLYGTLYFGGGSYFLPPSTADLSKSLVTTALVINPNSTAPIFSEGEASVEYFIDVRSIKIDAAPVKFNYTMGIGKDGSGGAKISTMDPYTTLNSHIYKPFVDLFMAKAAALKLVKVAPVAPFAACFSSKSIRYNAYTGKGIPIIDLVFNEKSAILHGKNARWRIYGSNSMVKVSSDVQCLGIVDAGKSDRSVVIGAKQLEDNLVEFDLQNGKLGFTSSLLRYGTSCSKVY
ncbi:hypothetical protein V2J09_019534 [Rumex salicifolius]